MYVVLALDPEGLVLTGLTHTGDLILLSAKLATEQEHHIEASGASFRLSIARGTATCFDGFRSVLACEVCQQVVGCG